MKTRIFISMMVLLLVFTVVLLAFSVPGKQQAQDKECPAGTSDDNNTQVQAADGSMIWESVSRHLLSAVQ
ncbi:MAG: hypothetical protein ABJB86_22615 [Bacteroidota bacterium]